jgi:hypothetical protein
MGFYPTRYFYIYLQGAYFFKNARYAAFAHRIMSEAIKYGRTVPDDLWIYMLYDGLKDYEPELEELETEYEMYNPSSSIYRKVEDDFSVSVIGNNANFLFIQKGELKCYARLCASFFMKAQFMPEKVEKDGDELVLQFSATDYYNKAFESKPPTSMWREMDHDKRQTCNYQTLNISARVKVVGKGVNMGIKTSGTDRVPFKAEFIVTSGSSITGEFFDVKGNPGESVIPHRGMVKVKKGKDKMHIGPAFKEHKYTTGMRGSVPASSRGFTIYFTDFTNLDREIKIRCE